MLKRLAAEQPKEWPRYIAPLLFVYREAPQSSLKFSPFELPYGSAVRDVKGVEVFVDDVLIHSANFEDNVRLLSVVLRRLCDVNMTVKPTKCEMAKSEIQFLGHKVSLCLEDKIQKIHDVLTPQTKKQVRAFLGLAGYYRRFVPNSSHHCCVRNQFCNCQILLDPSSLEQMLLVMD